MANLDLWLCSKTNSLPLQGTAHFSQHCHQNHRTDPHTNPHASSEQPSSPPVIGGATHVVVGGRRAGGRTQALLSRASPFALISARGFQKGGAVGTNCEYKYCVVERIMGHISLIPSLSSSTVLNKSWCPQSTALSIFPIP